MIAREDIMVNEYGYEYNAIIDKDLFFRVKCNGTDEKLWGAHCLRSGRDALKVIAREHPSATVYLPALCCESMITPFELYGCRIVFYQLKHYLTVDFSRLLEKLNSNNGQKLLLVYDYFGTSMFTTIQLEELKKEFSDLIIVRDVTHNLLSYNGFEHNVDYVIASLRKWSNIPDGGLLWSKRKLQNRIFVDESTFFKKRLYAQCLRTKYFMTGEESIKKRYRKLFSNVSLLLEKDSKPAKMSMYSYELSLKTDWIKIKKARRNNALILNDIFTKHPNIKLINDGVENCDLYVPILINNRDAIQSILSKKGIFNTVIWPLREEQINVCDTARYIVEHMLAVPCDQRYTKEDMAYIGTEIVRTINEKKDYDTRC